MSALLLRQQIHKFNNLEGDHQKGLPPGLKSVNNKEIWK